MRSSTPSSSSTTTTAANYIHTQRISQTSTNTHHTHSRNAILINHQSLVSSLTSFTPTSSIVTRSFATCLKNENSTSQINSNAFVASSNLTSTTFMFRKPNQGSHIGQRHFAQQKKSKRGLPKITKLRTKRIRWPLFALMFITSYFVYDLVKYDNIDKITFEMEHKMDDSDFDVLSRVPLPHELLKDKFRTIGDLYDAIHQHDWTREEHEEREKILQKINNTAPYLTLPPVDCDEKGRPKRTLVIDPDFTILYPVHTKRSGWVMYVRPGAEMFVSRLVKAGYELIAYTHQDRSIMEPVLVDFDASNNAFRHRLFDDNCLHFDSGFASRYYKEVQSLGRDPSRLIILTTPLSRHTFGPAGYENMLLIDPYQGESNDFKLLGALELLEGIQRYDVADVRVVLQNLKFHPRGTVRQLFGDQVADKLEAARQIIPEDERGHITIPDELKHRLKIENGQLMVKATDEETAQRMIADIEEHSLTQASPLEASRAMMNTNTLPGLDVTRVDNQVKISSHHHIKTPAWYSPEYIKIAEEKALSSIRPETTFVNPPSNTIPIISADNKPPPPPYDVDDDDVDD